MWYDKTMPDKLVVSMEKRLFTPFHHHNQVTGTPGLKSVAGHKHENQQARGQHEPIATIQSKDLPFLVIPMIYFCRVLMKIVSLHRNKRLPSTRFQIRSPLMISRLHHLLLQGLALLIQWQKPHPRSAEILSFRECQAKNTRRFSHVVPVYYPVVTADARKQYKLHSSEARRQKIVTAGCLKAGATETSAESPKPA